MNFKYMLTNFGIVEIVLIVLFLLLTASFAILDVPSFALNLSLLVIILFNFLKTSWKNVTHVKSRTPLIKYSFIASLAYNIFITTLLYGTFTPKGDATLYSSVIYNLLEEKIPNEHYYVVPLLPIALFSLLFNIPPTLSLILADISLRVILILLLFYIYLREINSTCLNDTILAILLLAGIISLNIPTYLIKYIVTDDRMITQFTYYKIFTDFNSLETYKLASIALFLLGILTFNNDLWKNCWKVLLSCAILTYYYPIMGLLALTSFTLSVILERKLTRKEKVKYFLKIILLTVIVMFSIYRLQKLFTKSPFISTYVTFTEDLYFFALFFSSFTMGMIYFTKNVAFIKKCMESIRRYNVFTKPLQLILSAISLILYDFKVWSSYYINIQYLSAYFIAIAPLTLALLLNNSNVKDLKLAKEIHLSLRNRFTILLIYFAICYYLFSIFGYLEMVYFLKGSICLNIIFLTHIFSFTMEMFRERKIRLNMSVIKILLIMFFFFSIFGFYESLNLWGSIDVCNYIGLTNSIFDDTHRQIEIFKKMIYDRGVVLVSSDLHVYHLLMLHGVPNLIHPLTLSFEDLPQDFHNETFTIQVGNKLSKIANIYGSLLQRDKSVYIILRGRKLNENTYISTVEYAAYINGGNLKRFSNYPTFYISSFRRIEKISNEIFIIETYDENIKVSHNMSAFIFNDIVYHILSFLQLFLLFLDIYYYNIF